MGIAASSEGKGLHMMLNDVKRAYFHAKSARELYEDIPKEDAEWTPDVVGRLQLALYGTRVRSHVMAGVRCSTLVVDWVLTRQVKSMRVLQQGAQTQNTFPWG